MSLSFVSWNWILLGWLIFRVVLVSWRVMWLMNNTFIAHSVSTYFLTYGTTFLQPSQLSSVCRSMWQFSGVNSLSVSGRGELPKFLEGGIFHVKATGKFQELTTRIREEMQLRQVAEQGEDLKSQLDLFVHFYRALPKNQQTSPDLKSVKLHLFFDLPCQSWFMLISWDCHWISWRLISCAIKLDRFSPMFMDKSDLKRYLSFTIKINQNVT